MSILHPQAEGVCETVGEGHECILKRNQIVPTLLSFLGLHSIFIH